MITSESPRNVAGILRRRMIVAAWGLVITLVAWSAWFGFWRHHLKRFDPVEPGVLYRVAQPTEYGLKHVVRHYQIRSVLSVRLEDPSLYRGWVDFGDPDGERESTYVPQLGTRFVQWPMGEETYWPWLTPWLLEEFYRFMDEPANLPVLVHCVGGRHRTGTFVALFQLEYGRRPVEEVLREMYSYDFGPPAPVHEHNLRTYLPRPLPNNAQWQELLRELLADVDSTARPCNLAELLRQLKSTSEGSDDHQRLEHYLASDRPFALCLAERLIDRPDHPLAAMVVPRAAEHLQTGQDYRSLASAAALVADYGTHEEQQRLLKLLETESQTTAPSQRYEAIVAGVTNRYTPNRIAYLMPLLKDKRQRGSPDTASYRYCDTAAARLISITNEPLYLGEPGRLGWDLAVGRALAWLDLHPASQQLSTLLPPLGPNEVRTGTNHEIDGSNMLR